MHAHPDPTPARHPGRRCGSIAVGLVAATVLSAAGCASPTAPVPAASSGAATANLPTANLPTMDVWTTLRDQAVPTVPGVSEIVVDRCAVGGVPVVISGQDAAMGQRLVMLTALNCTDAPVVLDGIPGTDFLDADGQRFDITAEPGVVGEPDTQASTEPVTLAPGAAAGTTLSWRNLTEYDGPETAESVVLTLDDELPPVTLELTVDLGTTHRAFINGWTPNDPAYPAPVTVTVTTTATPTG